MYGASAWSLVWEGKINQLEKIQRKLTKNFRVWRTFFIVRLDEHKALSLGQERRRSDLVLIYKCLHNLHNISGAELGLTLSRNSEQSGQIRLQKEKAKNETISYLFRYRAVCEWNNLLSLVRSASSLSSSKRLLFEHLFNE